MVTKKKTAFQVIPSDRLSQKIFTIRGQRVMIDYDLAELYGVQTKVLNQAVKRNAERFPDSFTFKLTPDEKKELVTNCDRLQTLMFSTVSPAVFTEHGVLMLANVLKSDRAIAVSIHIIEAFIRLKQAVITHVDLEKRIAEIEAKLSGHDEQFKIFQELVFPLLELNISQGRKIGFNPKDD